MEEAHLYVRVHVSAYVCMHVSMRGWMVVYKDMPSQVKCMYQVHLSRYAVCVVQAFGVLCVYVCMCMYQVHLSRYAGALQGSEGAFR